MNKETCLEEIPFSAQLSQELPVQYNLHNFPPMVHNMLSENEILCQAFNVTPNASQIWPWVGLIIIEAKRHRTEWFLPNHNFKFKMLNLLLSSSLKEKPFLFGRLKRKCKSDDKVKWFSFPLSSWRGLFTERALHHQHNLWGCSNWGQIWSSCFWLSDSC